MEIHAAGGGIHYTVDQTKKGPINKNYFLNPRTIGTQFRTGTTEMLPNKIVKLYQKCLFYLINNINNINMNIIL